MHASVLPNMPPSYMHVLRFHHVWVDSRVIDSRVTDTVTDSRAVDSRVVCEHQLTMVSHMISHHGLSPRSLTMMSFAEKFESGGIGASAATSEPPVSSEINACLSFPGASGKPSLGDLPHHKWL